VDAKQTPVEFDLQSVERSVENGGEHSSPGPTLGSIVVPSGQTWSFPSIVQLPFDANQPTQLAISGKLGWAQSGESGASEDVAAAYDFAPIPLRLAPAGPAQTLNLEVVADHQQWCVRATTISGTVPTGPLAASLIAGSSSIGTLGTTEFVDPMALTGNIWAGYWNEGFDPNYVEVWLGGQNYVTTMAQVTVTNPS
jgi:hypothetical protein